MAIPLFQTLHLGQCVVNETMFNLAGLPTYKDFSADPSTGGMLATVADVANLISAANTSFQASIDALPSVIVIDEALATVNSQAATITALQTKVTLLEYQLQQLYNSFGTVDGVNVDMPQIP